MDDLTIHFNLKQKDPVGRENRDSIAKFDVSVVYATRKYHLATLKLSEIRSLVGVPSTAWTELVRETKKSATPGSSLDEVRTTVTGADFRKWAKTFEKGYGFQIFQEWS